MEVLPIIKIAIPAWRVTDACLNGGATSLKLQRCSMHPACSLICLDEPYCALHFQAYYEEVTVCGNCMEICRKLDSIRSAGFPEGTTAASAGFAAIATASGDSPARPSSEPLPEFVTDISGQERPGTAISATEAIAPGDGYDASNIQWDDAVGDGNSAGARELSSTPPTLSQNSPADREGKIEVEQFEAEMGMKELIPEQQAVRIGGGEAVGEHDGQAPTEDVPCVEKSTVEKGVDEKAYTGRRKQKAVRELSWVI